MRDAELVGSTRVLAAYNVSKKKLEKLNEGAEYMRNYLRRKYVY